MSNTELACLLLGFDMLERALGPHGCDPIEQSAQLRELERQGQLCLLDAAHLVAECEAVQAVAAGHVASVRAFVSQA